MSAPSSAGANNSKNVSGSQHQKCSKTSTSTAAPVEEPVCKKKGFMGWLKEKIYSKEELESLAIEEKQKAKEKEEKAKLKQQKCTKNNNNNS